MYNKTVLVSLLSIMTSGCVSTSGSDTSPTASTATNQVDNTVSQKKSTTDKANNTVDSGKTVSEKTFYILASTPYSKRSTIESNIKLECTQLGRKLSDSMVNYADKHGIQVVKQEGVLPTKGRSVIVEIQDAYSGGNAFIGHYKSATVNVKYRVDGVVVDETTASRRSGGGVFGAFKSSCSVLGRTVNTIGSDIDSWLSTQ